MAAQPFTVRLPERTSRAVSEEARRTRRSRGAVVASLAEEALLCRRFPGVAFRGTDRLRRPWVIASGLDVWEIVAIWDDHDRDEQRVIEETGILEHALALALAYHREYPEEIDEAIADNRRPLAQWQAAFPSLRTLSVD